MFVVLEPVGHHPDVNHVGVYAFHLPDIDTAGIAQAVQAAQTALVELADWDSMLGVVRLGSCRGEHEAAESVNRGVESAG